MKIADYRKMHGTCIEYEEQPITLLDQMKIAEKKFLKQLKNSMETRIKTIPNY